MRLFLHPITLEVNRMAIRRAEVFADEVIKTVNYRDSNQTNLEKIKNDHFISKIGEEAVKKVFELFKHPVKGPDYRIYKGKNKSWEEDLFIGAEGLAVKTQKQTAAKKYGLSWTFQSSGYRNDPILKDPFAWVCFVACNDESLYYECTVYPPFQIRELDFKDPKLKYLIGKKKVVYAEDLKVLV